MSTLEKAIELAANYHAGQTDRGGAPYILHLLAVMMAVDGIGWCPKMYADKRRANKKQRRHGIFEVWKLKIPFAVPVAVGRI